MLFTLSACICRLLRARRSVPKKVLNRPENPSAISSFPEFQFSLSSSRYVFRDSFSSLRRDLRHGDGVHGGGVETEGLCGHRLGPECLTAHVHIPPRAPDCSSGRLRGGESRATAIHFNGRNTTRFASSSGSQAFAISPRSSMVRRTVIFCWCAYMTPANASPRR